MAVGKLLRSAALLALTATGFPVVAQDAQGPAVAKSDALQTGLAAPRVGRLRTAVRFSEDFTPLPGLVTGQLDPGMWSQARGVSLEADPEAPSPPTVALLEMSPQPESSALLATRPLNLSQLPGVKLSIWAQPVTQASSGRLVVQWQAGDRIETLLELDAAALDPGVYEWLSVSLPDDALRADVKFILTGVGEADWYVDDLRVIVSGLTLTVRAHPADAVEIAVFPPDVEGQSAGRPPFARHYDQAAPVSLAAPLRSGRLTFERWVVDGKCETAGEGRFTHFLSTDTLAVAEYALLGDMNGDGKLDRFDLDEFVLAMVDPLEYAERHPDLDRLRRGDLNSDGVIDRADIEPFVTSLLNP